MRLHSKKIKCEWNVLFTPDSKKCPKMAENSTFEVSFLWEAIKWLENMESGWKSQEIIIIVLSNTDKNFKWIAQKLISPHSFKLKIWPILQKQLYLNNGLTVFNVLWRECSQGLWLPPVKFSCSYSICNFSYNEYREKFAYFLPTWGGFFVQCVISKIGFRYPKPIYFR